MHFLDDAPCRTIPLNQHVIAYVHFDDPDRIIGCLIKNVVTRLGRRGEVGLGSLLAESGVPADKPGLGAALHQSLGAEVVRIDEPRASSTKK